MAFWSHGIKTYIRIERYSENSGDVNWIGLLIFSGVYTVCLEVNLIAFKDVYNIYLSIIFDSIHGNSERIGYVHLRKLKVYAIYFGRVVLHMCFGSNFTNIS